MRHADPIAQAAIDRLEAKVERLSSLLATYELDQQEDERIIAELRAKVAAVEKLASRLVSNGMGNTMRDRTERDVGAWIHIALRTKP
jgi:hypothetical protein